METITQNSSAVQVAKRNSVTTVLTDLGRGLAEAMHRAMLGSDPGLQEEEKLLPFRAFQAYK